MQGRQGLCCFFGGFDFKLGFDTSRFEIGLEHSVASEPSEWSLT